MGNLSGRNGSVRNLYEGNDYGESAGIGWSEKNLLRKSCLENNAPNALAKAPPEGEKIRQVVATPA